MGKGFDTIKNMVKGQTTEMLIEAYKQLPITEGSEVSDLVVHNAIESELEARGVLQYNEDTWEYEFI